MSTLIKIYSIRNALDGKRYVGQTSMTLMRRVHAHVGHAKQHGEDKSRVGYAMLTQGRGNFDFEILDVCATQEDADRFEAYWIDRLGTRSPDGYNIKGGGIHAKAAESTLLKIRKEPYYAKLKLREEIGPKLPRGTSPRALAALAEGRKHQRRRRGETVARAKLTDVQVTEIRGLYATREYTTRDLGSMFGVSHVTIGRVVRGTAWAHVPS